MSTLATYGLLKFAGVNNPTTEQITTLRDQLEKAAFLPGTAAPREGGGSGGGGGIGAGAAIGGLLGAIAPILMGRGRFTLQIDSI